MEGDRAERSEADSVRGGGRSCGAWIVRRIVGSGGRSCGADSEADSVRAIVRSVDSEVSDSEEWRAIVRSVDSEADSEDG